MTTRKYTSRSQQTTLTSAVTSGALSFPVVSTTTLLGGATISAGQTLTVVIDPDTALEEIIDITSITGTTILNVSSSSGRGVDGSGAQDHSAGAVVRHMIIGRDLREANLHIEASGSYNDGTGTHALHGLGSSDGVVVGSTQTVALTNKDLSSTSNTLPTSTVTLTGSQTLTNKTLTSPTINTPTISGANLSGTFTSSATITGGTINATTLQQGGSAVVVTGAASSITSGMITDGTIVDADISSSAAIANSKLATNPLARANHTGTQLASTISDFDTQVRTSRLDQMAAPTASVSMNTQKITNVVDPASNQDAATKNYVDTQVSSLVNGAPTTLNQLNELAAAIGNDANYSTTITTALATKLPLAGGTMTGAIAMSSNKITGLGTPTATGDAATKDYADTKLSLAGGTMTGAINHGGYKATNIADPTSLQDAVTLNYFNNTSLAPSNLTGVITSIGNVTSIASQTGTGTKFVVDTSPTLVTPTLGVATATSINGTTIPTSVTLTKTTDKLNVFAATSSSELAGIISDETGSGSLVFGTAPTLSNAVLSGTLSAGASVGTSGQLLSSTGTGVQWVAAPTGYSAPTLGSTSIASGSTNTTLIGFTKLRSAQFTQLDANSYEQDIALMNIMGAW